MHARTVKIKVNIDDGMFSSEKLIQIKTPSRYYNFFVDKEQVPNGEFMEFPILDEDNNSYLIELPTEDFFSGRIIRVEKAEIIEENNG